MSFDDLLKAFPFVQRADLLDRFLDLVLEANKTTNLTAIRDKDEAIVKHLYDCLLPLTITSIEGKKVLDIGSGAGFPGLVFAIVCPTSHLVLCESNGKKAGFLKKAIEALGLDNAEVLQSRAEEIPGRETYDVITARAVGSLPILLDISAPLLKKGATFVSMKGSEGEKEMDGALRAAKELGLAEVSRNSFELPEEKGKRVIGIYTKKAETPHKYPRPYAKMVKRPL